MTMAVDDVVASAARLLRDVSNSEWPAATLLKWVNEAQFEVVKAVPSAYTIVGSIPLVAGVRQTLPVDGIRLRTVLRNTNGAAVRPYDRESLDVELPGWPTSTASPTVKGWMALPEDPKGFDVYPPQPGTPGDVDAHYDAEPPPVTSGGNMALDDRYAPAIVDYAVYRGLSEDSDLQEDDRATLFYKSFYTRLGVKR